MRAKITGPLTLAQGDALTIELVDDAAAGSDGASEWIVVNGVAMRDYRPEDCTVRLQAYDEQTPDQLAMIEASAARARKSGVRPALCNRFCVRGAIEAFGITDERQVRTIERSTSIAGSPTLDPQRTVYQNPVGVDVLMYATAIGVTEDPAAVIASLRDYIDREPKASTGPFVPGEPDE